MLFGLRIICSLFGLTANIFVNRARLVLSPYASNTRLMRGIEYWQSEGGPNGGSVGGVGRMGIACRVARIFIAVVATTENTKRKRSDVLINFKMMGKNEARMLDREPLDFWANIQFIFSKVHVF